RPVRECVDRSLPARNELVETVQVAGLGTGDKLLIRPGHGQRSMRDSVRGLIPRILQTLDGPSRHSVCTPRQGTSPEYTAGDAAPARRWPHARFSATIVQAALSAAAPLHDSTVRPHQVL